MDKAGSEDLVFSSVQDHIEGEGHISTLLCSYFFLLLCSSFIPDELPACIAQVASPSRMHWSMTDGQGGEFKSEWSVVQSSTSIKAKKLRVM